MAIINLSINTVDNSSKKVEQIAKSYSQLKTSVETASKSVKGVGTAMTAVVGGAVAVIGVFKMIEKAGRIIDTAITKVGGDAVKNWEEFKNILNNIGKMIISYIQPVILSLAKTITTFIKSAQGINIISDAIAVVASAFRVLQLMIEPIIKVIKETFLKAINDLSRNFTNLTNSSDTLTNALGILKPIMIGVGVSINVVINIIKSVIQAFIDWARIIIITGDLIGKVFTGKWGEIGETAKKVGEAVKNFTSNIVTGTTEMFESAIKAAADLDKSIDINRIGVEAKKVYNETKENVTKNLMEISKSEKEMLESSKENWLIWSKELEKDYERYTQIKKDLDMRNYKSAKEYFEKLNELNKLYNKQGIKELDEYYKNIKNETLKITEILKAINPIQYLIGGKDELSTMIIGVEKTFASLAEGIVSLFESTKNKTQKVLEGIALGVKMVGEVFNEVMNFISVNIEKSLQGVKDKWDKYFIDIEKKRQRDILNIDNYTKEMLMQLGLAEKTEIEKAQEKLEELQKIQQEGYDIETENRLRMLDDYYSSLDNQTDYEIEQAYKRQRARILEQEEKKRISIQEQIEEQQKEIKKLQILDEAEKKKRAIEDNYNKKKIEAERRMHNELNEMERMAFEANKATQIANVWISTAIGIATAWGTSMQLGFPAGVIVAGILTGLLTANAIAQTVLISQQQYTPKNMATGGVIVGETGRELIDLPNGTRVYNNDETERMLDKEITIVNNIYIDTEKIQEIIMRKRINIGLRGV